MDIPVLVQPVPGKGFVATAPGFGWSAEGATPWHAVRNLRAEALKCIAAGCMVGTIDVPLMTDSPPPAENPWLRIAGMWKDDPTIDEFRQDVEEYRREVDRDPNR